MVGEAPPVMTDEIDVADLTVDAIADQNDEVANLVETKNDLESEIDSLEDHLAELEEQKSAVKNELDSVREELDSYKDNEKEEKIEEITTLTDRWGKEELRELDLDTLDDRLTLSRDVATSASTPVADNDGRSGRRETDTADLSHTA